MMIPRTPNNDDHVIDKIAAIDLLKNTLTKNQKKDKVHKWEEVKLDKRTKAIESKTEYTKL